MKVYIRDSGKLETLILVDHIKNVEFCLDLVATTGAVRDGRFTWVDEFDAYVCDQDTFDWWKSVIYDYQVLENKKHALSNLYSFEVIESTIQDATQYSDFEDAPNDAYIALCDLENSQ